MKIEGRLTSEWNDINGQTNEKRGDLRYKLAFKLVRIVQDNFQHSLYFVTKTTKKQYRLPYCVPDDISWLLRKPHPYKSYSIMHREEIGIWQQ